METKKYIKSKGFCSFKNEKSLLDETANIPDGYGVFILRKNEKDGEILYIGYSGTPKQDGTFKTQELRKRINNKQNSKQRRQDFLIQKMREDSTLKEIIIEWWIIDEKKRLPSEVKEDLLCCLAHNNRWPRWNRQSLSIR